MNCPYMKQHTAVDYKRDKVYEGPVMCDLVDKWCLLESGMECEEYDRFLKESDEVSEEIPIP